MTVVLSTVRLEANADIKRRNNNYTTFLMSALLGSLTRLNWSVRDKDKQGDESKGHYSNLGGEDCG